MILKIRWAGALISEVALTEKVFSERGTRMVLRPFAGGHDARESLFAGDGMALERPARQRRRVGKCIVADSGDMRWVESLGDVGGGHLEDLRDWPSYRQSDPRNPFDPF